MTERLYTLRSDNATPKRTIQLTENEIEYYCKSILKWRTSKGYESIKDRIMYVGSSTYDKFIEAVYQLKRGGL